MDRRLPVWVAAFLLVCGAALGQTSTSYDLEENGFNSGGTSKKLNALTVVLCSLVVSGAATAQLSEMDRTSVFREDIVRFSTLVTLCHIPRGLKAPQTIEVAPQAVPSHLAHGDSLGECLCECDGPPAPVAKTGQTGCWDDDFPANPIDCAGTGQDGEYQHGVSVDPRFTDNGDGTVTDNLTRLIWLQDANCFGQRRWWDALSDANLLADGSCGLTDGSVAGDWRLPNVSELLGLIDYGQQNPAVPPSHPFSGVQSDDYWSSTSVSSGVYSPEEAWHVRLDIGFVFGVGKFALDYVWPVRGGQASAPPEFSDDTDLAFEGLAGGSGSVVTLCHIPPGSPENAQTIEVAPQAVPPHLAHGDLLEECPYECDGPPAPVAKTGQTGCWDDDFIANPIDCAGTGQDGEYQYGVSVDPRFTDNGDGTVADNLTGLIWLQDANCFGERVWWDALSDANLLADGSCGLTDGSVAGDWRLPNVRELLSLIDFGWFPPLALPPGHPFSGVVVSPSDRYWSSSTGAYAPNHAWYVRLAFAEVIGQPKDGTCHVWSVRGGQ